MFSVFFFRFFSRFFFFVFALLFTFFLSIFPSRLLMSTCGAHNEKKWKKRKQRKNKTTKTTQTKRKHTETQETKTRENTKTTNTQHTATTDRNFGTHGETLKVRKRFTLLEIHKHWEIGNGKNPTHGKPPSKKERTDHTENAQRRKQRKTGINGKKNTVHNWSTLKLQG